MYPTRDSGLDVIVEGIAPSPDFYGSKSECPALHPSAPGISLIVHSPSASVYMYLIKWCTVTSARTSQHINKPGGTTIYPRRAAGRWRESTQNFHFGMVLSNSKLLRAWMSISDVTIRLVREICFIVFFPVIWDSFHRQLTGNTLEPMPNPTA